MPNVNIADLRASLKSCVEFCREHESREYCQRHLPILERALDELRESRRQTDEYFVEWREEQREQRQSWKRLAKLLRETQDELDRVNAVGYPDQRIMYWDQELLEETVREMIGFLEGQGDEIEFAGNYSDKLERTLEGARDEDDEQSDALRAYQGRVKKRSDAMGGAAQVVADFRELLRDELGVDDPEYQSLRWPYALSPDQASL